LVIHPNTPGAQCPDSSTLSFLVEECPGQIIGYVKTVSGTGIVNVNVRLHPDANEDGVADGPHIRNVFTNSAGQYSMASIDPGSYVIVELQPSGWTTVDDYDASDDGDAVINISSTDNLIPVTIIPEEFDTMNNFIESPIPGTITGNVFVDTDNDMLPDAGEGLGSVTLRLFTDSNVDGVADNGTPVLTQTSNANGSYTFSGVPVGSYVLVETNPTHYLSVKDYDSSNDGDVVPNTNMNNDTIPLTITNTEIDANNYFIDEVECNLMVINTDDDHFGSLRYNIDCAQSGDTIRFDNSLTGQTIHITSSMLSIEKNLVFVSTLSPTVTISSSILGLFDIQNGWTAEFRDIDFISGISPGNTGAAFDNQGILKLHNVSIYRNPGFPSGQYLIRNISGSTMMLSGSNMIDY
jgi:hypothetical protein